MRINSRGISLIKDFEGCRLKAYRDIVGKLTIGYGHVLGVRGGQEITQEEAETMLREDLRVRELRLEDDLTMSLSSNQYSAIVSLVFNIGLANFRASTLLARLKEGRYQEAADEFLHWKYAGKAVSSGLIRRREAERELFLTPDGVGT